MGGCTHVCVCVYVSVCVYALRTPQNVNIMAIAPSQSMLHNSGSIFFSTLDCLVLLLPSVVQVQFE